MEAKIVIEVVDSLIGNISGVGCSTRDEKYLHNIKVYREVVEHMVSELNSVARDMISHESSVKEIAQQAHNCLCEVRHHCPSEES